MDIYSPFLNSAKAILKKMAKIEVSTDGIFHPEDKEIESKGISSVVTYNGRLKGRMLLDMSQDTALNLVKSITGKTFQDAKEFIVLAAICELNNTIAGDGITYLNDQYSLSLRLVPPYVFVGKNALICLDKIPSKAVICSTIYGEIRIIVAFEGEVN